jgi:lycopene cyclase domain-containing protein
VNLVYAASLLVSIACMVALDVRFSLVFRRRPAIGALALIIGLGFFLAWDAVGIGLGVFRHVDSQWASGMLLAPAFPVEELLFLVFLSYLTLILLSGWQRWRARRETEGAR